MIPRRDLSLLSNRLARKGARRLPEAVLEKDHCLSWFLVGMSATPLRDILAFKGGTAIRCKISPHGSCLFSRFEQRLATKFLSRMGTAVLLEKAKNVLRYPENRTDKRPDRE
jgi:predicted nucleotidyltransferase component of viral defense system